MKPEGRSESANLHIYIYICHLADAFNPKRLSISAFNHEGTNPEQQESRKYNFFKTNLQSAISKCHLSATKLLV